MTDGNGLSIVMFPNELKSDRMQMSSVTVFVLTMGFVQFLSSRRYPYTLQYLSEAEEYKTVYRIQPTVKVSQFLKIACLQFIYIRWLQTAKYVQN